MKRLTLLLVMAVGLLAPLAAPAGTWTTCTSAATPAAVSREVRPNKALCYRFVAGEAVAFVGTMANVTSASALLTFDPDIAQASDSGAATVQVYVCPPYVTAPDALQCTQISADAGADLTGLGGTSATQLAALRLPIGYIALYISAAPIGGEVAVVTITGEP